MLTSGLSMLLLMAVSESRKEPLPLPAASAGLRREVRKFELGDALSVVAHAETRHWDDRPSVAKAPVASEDARPDRALLDAVVGRFIVNSWPMVVNEGTLVIMVD